MSTFRPRRTLITRYFSFAKRHNIQVKQLASLARGYKKLAATCEFHDASREIKSAVIQNCLSKRLRRYVLREDTLKLEDLLAKARSLEASETQATGIEKNLPSEEINQLSQKRQQSKLPMKKPPRQSTQSNSNTC